MRIYLAGPDVFLPDAQAVADAKKALCRHYGAVGVFPTDLDDAAPDEAGAERWFVIYTRNEAHMRGCDAVIANLTPFRGPSADVGTVYELGFMRALGRRVTGYSNVAATLLDRTLRLPGTSSVRDADGRIRDPEGLAIEDFGLVDNLMIDGGIRAAGGCLVTAAVPAERIWQDLGAFEACLRHLMHPAHPPPGGMRSPG